MPHAKDAKSAEALKHVGQRVHARSVMADWTIYGVSDIYYNTGLSYVKDRSARKRAGPQRRRNPGRMRSGIVAAYRLSPNAMDSRPQTQPPAFPIGSHHALRHFAAQEFREVA